MRRRTRGGLEMPLLLSASAPPPASGPPPSTRPENGHHAHVPHVFRGADRAHDATDSRPRGAASPPPLHPGGRAEARLYGVPLQQGGDLHHSFWDKPSLLCRFTRRGGVGLEGDSGLRSCDRLPFQRWVRFE